MQEGYLSKLSAAQRKKLPAKDFAGPNRSFPINDQNHAEAAERMTGRAVKSGLITEAQAQHIKARAKAKLERSK